MSDALEQRKQNFKGKSQFSAAEVCCPFMSLHLDVQAASAAEDREDVM
jgi:hypothetical protein